MNNNNKKLQTGENNDSDEEDNINIFSGGGSNKTSIKLNTLNTLNANINMKSKLSNIDSLKPMKIDVIRGSTNSMLSSNINTMNSMNSNNMGIDGNGSGGNNKLENAARILEQQHEKFSKQPAIGGIKNSIGLYNMNSRLEKNSLINSWNKNSKISNNFVDNQHVEKNSPQKDMEFEMRKGSNDQKGSIDERTVSKVEGLSKNSSVKKEDEIQEVQDNVRDIKEEMNIKKRGSINNEEENQGDTQNSNSNNNKLQQGQENNTNQNNNQQNQNNQNQNQNNNQNQNINNQQILNNQQQQQQQIKEETDPRMKLYNIINSKEVIDFANLKYFLYNPVPKTETFRCNILRKNDGIDKMYPKYFVYSYKS